MSEAPPEPDRVEGTPHPRHTRQLFGQAGAERRAAEALAAGRLTHGWLIAGPRGVGKATLAWRIARALLSAPAGAPGRLDPDPDHPVCRRIDALSELRLFLCRRPWDARRERLRQEITVEEIRRLTGFFTLSAADGGHRVALIDAADELNPNAANALLKILEEPPENTTILLIAHQSGRLLPTIRSRCRRLDCAPLEAGDLGQALTRAGLDPEQETAALAALAAGSVGEAARLLQEDGPALYRSLAEQLGRAPGMARPGLLALAQTCTGAKAEARYDLTLRLISVALHRLAITGARPDPLPEACPGEAGILRRLAPDARAARAWAALAENLRARAAHARAVNLDPASVILDMLLKMDQMAGRQAAA